MVDRYEELLLFKESDYEEIDIAKKTFRDVLSPEFRRAVSRVRRYPYDDPIRDVGGTAAVALASREVNNGTAAPTLSGAAVDGSALTLTYGEALDEASVPAATDYAVTVAGSARTVSTVAVSGSKVTLTLASAVTAGQLVQVGYTVPAVNPIRDVGGTAAVALASREVNNGTAAPTLSGAAVDGSALTLTYGEALDEASVPAATDYAVTVAGSARTVSTVAVSGSKVTLTLASAVTAGQLVQVGYTVPAVNPIRDVGGTAAVALASREVNNGTAAPTLSGAAVDGSALTLTYSEALDETAKPEPGAYAVTVAGSARTVSTVAVSGSKVTLTLASAVTAGQLVQVGYTVPAVNPIRDVGGTAAVALASREVNNGTAAPTLSGAAVDGSALTLTYGEALDETAKPEPGAYAVTVAGSARTVSTVAVSGSKVTLTLASAVTADQVVKVSYTQPVRQIALFVKRDPNAPPPTDEERALEALNDRLHNLINTQIPRLVFAYLTPGIDGEVENPYYNDPTLVDLYVRALEHCYLRGLTENAWLPDHAGVASSEALSAGLDRSSGDFSTVSLRLAGFIQSVFLMRDALEARDLLDKYRKVVRNLVVNNGTMYPVFQDHARADAGIRYENISTVEKYHVNADGVRLFVDNFWPYYLLTKSGAERTEMNTVLSGFISKNIAVTPGVQATIKPDGTGFHHGTAYVGAYTPFAIAGFAQLLYMVRGTNYYTSGNVDVVKLGITSFRQMVQKYATSASLRGRFIKPTGIGVSGAITKAMLFLAHLEGVSTSKVTGQFKEFFDEGYFYSESEEGSFGQDEEGSQYHEGGRGLQIRGLGIYRLVKELQDTTVSATATPSGFWVKPFAAAAFYRNDDWLVTAKGFSQYFWDYEGPLDSQENSFGQNWAYGLLQVFNAGTPIGEVGSGHDLLNGWDWYHVPGTTASHYPIVERTHSAVRALRTSLNIRQRDTHRNYNTKKFVGGVSVGDAGMFVQDLEALPFITTTNLQARKSYYFVGGQVLALGTHISGRARTHRTQTTIFQTTLDDDSTPTWVDGVRVTGLAGQSFKDAGTTVQMTDSVGNSYYLAHSTDRLTLSRALQSSMTDQYVATSGEYAKAYLDHGLNPRGDSYQYVLIPNDTDRSKLAALAADPSAYFNVLKSDSMHVVEFPAQSAVGYAFFELVDTPSETLVKSANLNAAVMTVEVGDTVRVAASVPDMGWQFDPAQIERLGLGYTNKQFARQETAEHNLSLVLRGNWCLRESPDGANTSFQAGNTTLNLQCSDGMTTEVLLESCPTISQDLTGDGQFDADDSLALYYAKKLGTDLTDETTASAQLRATLLTDLARGSDRTDAALRAIVLNANTTTASVADTYLDVNGDSSVDADDFLILFYAHKLGSLVGDGVTGGSVRFRRELLSGLAGVSSPTDEYLKGMLTRANSLIATMPP